jgi:uncharacterized repeat protein (TIGR03837 family)
MPLRWDIFCTVIDNYGDIGIAWRLARQLAAEHGLAVRLWVDDLTRFAKLRPEIDPVLAEQVLEDVEVRFWSMPFPHAEPADVVIEALACHLPEDYIEAMAAREKKPVWINLEYLSAEDWVAGCHALPSPHPRLPLTKYFFFPGWHTGGGVLREADLAQRRDAFRASTEDWATFWERLGLWGFPPPFPLPSPGHNTPHAGEGLNSDDIVRISLFSYDNTAIPALLEAWASGPERVQCLLPVGPALPGVAQHLGAAHAAPGTTLVRGQLSLHVLPWLAQDDYDRLLWACDCNFVRGEDSFVRAQLAQAPFVWQAYRQEEGAHWAKIDAFLKRYGQGLGPEAGAALRRLWSGWNRGELDADAWPAFWRQQAELRRHAVAWAEETARLGDLAANLVNFCSEKAQ